MKAVNLLPPDLRGATAPKARPAPVAEGSGPFVVLGALALCVLAMAAWVLASNTVTERRGELAALTAEYEGLSARAAALKPYGDFQDIAVRRRETVSSLASLRFDWEQALRDVSHALPADVTLSSLEGSVSGDAGAGAGPLRGAIASPAITLKGCTSDQAAVASMLSRLRGIRGVTRASLSKSERVKDTAATDTQGGPCGPGAPPQFEVIVFFERSVAATAPASASDGVTPPAQGDQPTAAGQPWEAGTAGQVDAAPPAGQPAPDPSSLPAQP